MGNRPGNSSEDTHRFTPDTSVRDIIEALEKHGGRNVPTSDIADEIDYTLQGTTKRLRNLSEYVEEKSLGEGNPILWSLKYEKRDFLDALSNDELGDLSRTDQIAEHLGCDEDVVLEWMFKLEDEDEVVSKPDGAGGWIWAKKS
jgi:predicted transcriptional regulator